MANPRELAEKAFTLLQDALRVSESQASELDAELKRKRVPKNRLEERLDVLTHRLKGVEADAERWQREAGHLEEVLENERVKVQQLKKKLELAESGPDKITKKEINFWRQRAEEIDAETRDYKNRIASLRKELSERAAVDPANLPAQDAAMQAPAPDIDTAELERLREQVATRDNEIDELQAELSRLAKADDGNADTDTEALRRSVGYLESALSDAQAVKANLNEQLEALQQELAASREASANAERATDKLQETINERDSRVAGLAAELEKTRAELTNRADSAAALRMELDAAMARSGELEQRVDELSGQFDQAQQDTAKRHDEVEQYEQRLQRLQSELEAAREIASQTGDEVAARDKSIEQLQTELDSVRRAAEQNDADIQSRRQKIDDLSAELGNVRVALAETERERNTLREQSSDQGGELEQLRTDKQRLEAELSELISRSDAAEHAARELSESMLTLKDAHADKDGQIAELRAKLGELEHDGSGVREQIAGLEAELKEEKECTANLSEVANERREAVTKLEEQLEEAEERYAEAKWQLGKAAHFERLVQRRKGLIAALIETLRAKTKANSALKAGLDGLRTFKATSEANQQKMLVRIDKLKSELSEAKQNPPEAARSEELEQANTRIEQLEERLGTQAELIQNLEGDLKAAKVMSRSSEDHATELEQLKQELDVKNQAIERLEADADEQQRKLAKLRGSESETMRLKGLAAKDHSKIDALEREIAQLREALTRKESQDGTAGEGSDSDLIDKLKERDSSIARLMGTVKEQETTLAELRESLAKWKKKYEFLSTEPPSAYQSVAEK